MAKSIETLKIRLWELYRHQGTCEDNKKKKKMMMMMISWK